jgi:glutathione S-transferase
MDLYYGRMSGNSARAFFGLTEAAVPFRAQVIDARGGENKSPAYLAVNPMGKIPSLTDGDFKLWESNAINWYAAEKFPQARLLPATQAGRADVQRWLFFQGAHVSPACVPVFRSITPRVLAFWGGARPRAPAVESARKELARFLPVLEDRLQTREWLAGEFSLADVAYAPHLALLAEGGFEFSPRVGAWLDRLLARPAWRKTAEAVLTA